MRYFYKLTNFRFQIILSLFTTQVFAQTYKVVPNASVPAINHSVYLNADGKVGCTSDEATILEAKRINPENIIPNASFIHSATLTPEFAFRTVTSANLSVTYTGFTPQAQAAFQAAVNVWASLLSSSQQIRISATFKPLSGSLLGYAGPNYFQALSDGTNYWFYPDALADALTSSDLSPGLSDINATFNSSFSFYFGTDGNCPSNQIDFMSVVLHELGHGLGFLGSGRIGGASPQAPCTTDATMACFGFVSGLTYPVIFDAYVKNSANNATATSLTNSASYANPSVSMKSLFTSGSLYFQSATVRSKNSGNGALLYAPGTFATGSSFSHLDETAYTAASANALMTPTLSYGETEHSLGTLGCGAFKDLGWSVAGACLSVLPVELSTFTAQNKGRSNILKWQTVSEINNSHFEIQHSSDAQKFENIGEVKGVGSSNSLQNYSFSDDNPLEGVNYYRLRQVDIDGKATLSNVVSVLYGKIKNNFSVQSNVAQSEIFISTPEAKTTDTPFEIVDVLGRSVQSSVFKNNQTAMKINIESIATGQYFIHFYSDVAPLRFVKM